MSLCVISFTQNGMECSKMIAEKCETEDVRLFTKCSICKEQVTDVEFVKDSITKWTREQMEKKYSLLFIGACGIAVRAIAPCVVDKLTDSPVLVMDEKGKYIIPVLSGHMGGANELAGKLAQKTGAQTVITTATDINERFAVDLFAKKNGLYIANKDGIAKVSSKVLSGKEIFLSVETGHIDMDSRLPEGITIVEYPPTKPVDVVISEIKPPCETLLYLQPREYVLGMGCKKGMETGKIEDLIHRKLDESGIRENQIFALASIDIKSREEGFLSWSRKRGVPFLTFSAEQLQEVTGRFQSSDFVLRQTGVDNVCERAALRGCKSGGKLMMKKYAENGITIAIAKREWRVFFDEK